MSASGNCVSIRDGVLTLSPCNANEVCEVTAFGPKVTWRFLQVWKELCDIDSGWAGSDYWLEEHFSDGGLLVDYDKRIVLIYTEYRSLGFQLAYAETFRQTWPGWELRWAYNGATDQVRHAGLDPAIVRRIDPLPEPFNPGLSHEPAFPHFLVTVNQLDGTQAAYGLNNSYVQPWRVGPALLDALTDKDRITTCAAHPEAGLHLDLADRRAGIWCTADGSLRDIQERWEEAWPGWKLEFWENRCDEQARVFERPGLLPAMDPAQERRRFAQLVVNTWGFFIAEDVDANCRARIDDMGTRSGELRSVWELSRKQTMVTRLELSAALAAITGRGDLEPRWPDLELAF